MWSELWIGYGIFNWVLGFMGTIYRKKIGMPIEKFLARPPFLIYLVCGMPRAQDIPPGVMVIPALIVQLMGLSWVAYGLIYPYLPAGTIDYQIYVIGLGAILFVVYGWILYKRNLYKDE